MQTRAVQSGLSVFKERGRGEGRGRGGGGEGESNHMKLEGKSVWDSKEAEIEVNREGGVFA